MFKLSFHISNSHIHDRLLSLQAIQQIESGGVQLVFLHPNLTFWWNNAVMHVFSPCEETAIPNKF